MDRAGRRRRLTAALPEQCRLAGRRPLMRPGEPSRMGGSPGPWPSYAGRMNVGIVGLGYVGLPLAVSFCEAGHRVVGVDVDPRKVGALKSCESYIEDVPSETLEEISASFFPTLRFAELSR